MVSYNISNCNTFGMGIQIVILKEKKYFSMLLLQDIRLVKDYFGTFLSIFGLKHRYPLIPSQNRLTF